MAQYTLLVKVLVFQSAALFFLLTFYFSGRRLLPDGGRNYQSLGRWEPSVPLPLVPAAAALLPISGQVLLWAADRGDVFDSRQGEYDKTIAAIYDPSKKSATSGMVSNMRHGMFCPGVAMQSDGRVVVTGGKTSPRTSIYDERISQWIIGPNMTMGRGYHAQATLSNGNIFTIGGSWSGGIGGEEVPMKNGEVFDQKLSKWTKLTGCAVEPMLTNGSMGKFESDNHAWLFAWKNGSVFQAGPSQSMNWYDTHHDGKTIAAGPREHDADSMNGNAVMYDAVHGKILTLGGAPSYRDSHATEAAHIITLSAEYELPKVQRIASMRHRRAYANSVLLPTGDVFINGGVNYAKQFTDKNATWFPELWNSQTHQFTALARMPIPRAYHSIALLLPDGTVLTGGGGLCYKECEDPTANHMDIQVFTPPFFFHPGTGKLAPRPRILDIDMVAMRTMGSAIVVKTDSEIPKFTLVRHSSVTHSINTDQRLVHLNSKLITSSSASYQRWIYKVAIPDESGVILPGYWMLFAINDHGVPSISATVQIKTPDA